MNTGCGRERRSAGIGCFQSTRSKGKKNDVPESALRLQIKRARETSWLGRV